MFYRILFLAFIIPASLLSQEGPYRLALSLGSQSSVDEPLGLAPSANLSFERTSLLGLRTDFFIGAGLQYGSNTSGLVNQRCDFIIGQKVANFNFSETYTTRQLDAFLSVGLAYHFGNFRLRGALHPMLRLHSQLRAAERFDFSGSSRPNISNLAVVAPGEQFQWNDGVQRELTFDTPFQLQGSLEINFDLTPGVALGVGGRQGIFDYIIRNTAVDWAALQCDPEPCGSPFIPYETGQSDLKARTGYVVLRLSL